MIKMILLHKKSSNLYSGAQLLANKFRNHLGDRVLGPEFTIVPRINNYYQQQIILKIEKVIFFSVT